MFLDDAELKELHDNEFARLEKNVLKSSVYFFKFVVYNPC